jgi:hypothetical protein
MSRTVERCCSLISQKKLHDLINRKRTVKLKNEILNSRHLDQGNNYDRNQDSNLVGLVQLRYKLLFSWPESLDWTMKLKEIKYALTRIKLIRSHLDSLGFYKKLFLKSKQNNFCLNF